MNKDPLNTSKLSKHIKDTQLLQQCKSAEIKILKVMMFSFCFRGVVMGCLWVFEAVVNPCTYMQDKCIFNSGLIMAFIFLDIRMLNVLTRIPVVCFCLGKNVLHPSLPHLFTKTTEKHLNA